MKIFPLNLKNSQNHGGKRRNEAHNYFSEFMKNNNLKFKKNLDYYVTKIVNKFIK